MIMKYPARSEEWCIYPSALPPEVAKGHTTQGKHMNLAVISSLFPS